MFIQFLKESCPPFRQKWKIILLVNFCTCFILVALLILNAAPIFQSNHIVFGTNYLLVTSVCCYCVMVFMPILLKQENWTIWKYFVCVFIDIVLISFGNILVEQILIRTYGSHFLLLMHKESMFFYNLKITLSFNIAGGLVIGTVVYFFIKNIELSDLLQEQEAMNEQLSTSKAPLSKPDEGVITLSGKTKDLITLNPENILYIESSGNYANIYFLEDGKASRRTLRATIQQMEDSLRDYPAIMRSHRAYIVNTSHIERVINSNHQFLLVLKTIDKEIPVSRTYKKNIPSYSRKTTPFHPVFL